MLQAAPEAGGTGEIVHSLTDRRPQVANLGREVSGLVVLLGEVVQRSDIGLSSEGACDLDGGPIPIPEGESICNAILQVWVSIDPRDHIGKPRQDVVRGATKNDRAVNGDFSDTDCLGQDGLKAVVREDLGDGEVAQVREKCGHVRFLVRADKKYTSGIPRVLQHLKSRILLGPDLQEPIELLRTVLGLGHGRLPGMPSQQSTSASVPIVVQADPPLDSDTPPVGSEIDGLLVDGKSAGKLEIFILSDTTQTITDVRISLREDNLFAIVAQGGIGDKFFAALDVVAGRTVKFVVADAGRPTHAVVSAGIPSGSVTASAKRLES